MYRLLTQQYLYASASPPKCLHTLYKRSPLSVAVEFVNEVVKAEHIPVGALLDNFSDLVASEANESVCGRRSGHISGPVANHDHFSVSEAVL